MLLRAFCLTSRRALEFSQVAHLPDRRTGDSRAFAFWNWKRVQALQAPGMDDLRLARPPRPRYSSHFANDATNLGVVEISDNTIAAVNSGEFGYSFGLYWPRQVYGRALEELTRQGAKAVAFDVLFAERRPDQPTVSLPDGSTIASDDFFALQLKKASNAILAADQDLLPDPLFRTNAWRIGNITTERDPDGVLRRDQAFTDYRDWHPFHQHDRGLQSRPDKNHGRTGQITFFRKGELRKSFS